MHVGIYYSKRNYVQIYLTLDMYSYIYIEFVSWRNGFCFGGVTFDSSIYSPIYILCINNLIICSSRRVLYNNTCERTSNNRNSMKQADVCTIWNEVFQQKEIEIVLPINICIQRNSGQIYEIAFRFICKYTCSNIYLM